MNNGILVFDNNILCLEQEDNWKEAANNVYAEWEEHPDNIIALICAGTEIWYALLVIDYYRYAPCQTVAVDACDIEEMQAKLWRVAQFGEQHFSEDANFNAYFGYMYKVKPHYFWGYGGDYDGWQKRGYDMMRKSALLDRENLFAVAMACEMDSGGDAYHQACSQLWSQLTPSQWGSGAVQEYFFRILNGELFHPGTYE